MAAAENSSHDSVRLSLAMASPIIRPFAYFAAAVLLWAGVIGVYDVAAAWLFFAGRVIHTAVQVLTVDVALRGQVYMINFLAIVALMGHVAQLVWKG